MTESLYKVCSNCGKKNLNIDYCEYCGAIINPYLERRLKRKQKEAQKARKSDQNSITVFFENARQHQNIVVRALASFFYSIWVIVIAIGSFLAFLFGYVAA